MPYPGILKASKKSLYAFPHVVPQTILLLPPHPSRREAVTPLRESQRNRQKIAWAVCGELCKLCVLTHPCHGKSIPEEGGPNVFKKSKKNASVC